MHAFLLTCSLVSGERPQMSLRCPMALLSPVSAAGHLHGEGLPWASPFPWALVLFGHLTIFCLLVFRGATRLPESLVSSFSPRLWHTENMCFLNDRLSTQGPGAGAPGCWEAASVRCSTMSGCSLADSPPWEGPLYQLFPNQETGPQEPHSIAKILPIARLISRPLPSLKLCAQVAPGRQPGQEQHGEGGFIIVPEGLFLVFSVAPPCTPPF